MVSGEWNDRQWIRIGFGFNKVSGSGSDLDSIRSVDPDQEGKK
jgi:hypothetical protein